MQRRNSVQRATKRLAFASMLGSFGTTASLAQLLMQPSASHAFVMPVPEQMPQSVHVDPSVVERDEGRQLEGTQAAHDLLDMVQAWRDETSEESLHWATCGRAHQRRLRGSPSLMAVTASLSRQP